MSFKSLGTNPVARDFLYIAARPGAGFSDFKNFSTPFHVILMSFMKGWFALTKDFLLNMKLQAEILRNSSLFCIHTDWNLLLKIKALPLVDDSNFP